VYDDVYSLNTQSGTQWDGFRHISFIKTGQFYNGATGAHIDGAEANQHRCSIHHWSDHGIGGRGVLLDYWTYAQENGIKYGEPASKYPERMIAQGHADQQTPMNTTPSPSPRSLRAVKHRALISVRPHRAVIFKLATS
jgi:hypothetical protein